MTTPDHLAFAAAALALLAVLRGAWLWEIGYRAGFRQRGRDAQAELKEEWDKGYRCGRWHRPKTTPKQ